MSEGVSAAVRSFGHGDFAPAIWLRERLDASRFFPPEGPLWTDAMVSRTRRHIGGCIVGIDAMLRLRLAEQIPASLLDSVPPEFCWRAVETKPEIVGAALFDHFRLRAAIGLMTTAHEERQVSASETVHDRLTGLSLLTARWAEHEPEDKPMRVDLPAEHFASVLWTVAALLAGAFESKADMPPADIVRIIDRQASLMLMGYDEEAGPVAVATSIALQAVREGVDISALVADGHYLVAFALAALRLDLDCAGLAEWAVHRSAGDVAAVLERAGLPSSTVMAIALALQPVRLDMTDGAIAAAAGTDVDKDIALLSAKPAFRAALRLARGDPSP